MNVFKFFIVGATVLLISSCMPNDKEVMPNPDAVVLFSFSTTSKGQPIIRSTSVHTHISGNNYKVDLLKYYISNITLVDDKGLETNYKNYNLIDVFDVNSTSFVLNKKVINGNYRKIIFYVGIDQERNHTGAQEGALSASNGMLWTWAFGYVFYKMEGRFTSVAVPTETSFRNHLGTDTALVKIALPVVLDVKGLGRKINISLDIDKVLGMAASAIDFSIDNNRQSNIGDEVWMNKMTSNMSQAFTLSGIE